MNTARVSQDWPPRHANRQQLIRRGYWQHSDRDCRPDIGPIQCSNYDLGTGNRIRNGWIPGLLNGFFPSQSVNIVQLGITGSLLGAVLLLFKNLFIFDKITLGATGSLTYSTYVCVLDSEGRVGTTFLIQDQPCMLMTLEAARLWWS